MLQKLKFRGQMCDQNNLNDHLNLNDM